jgi:hypothetical protein
MRTLDPGGERRERSLEIRKASKEEKNKYHNAD